LTTQHAIDLLQGAVKDGYAKVPFYLAVGYHKPHMPWIAKQKHFDMYPLDQVTVAKYSTKDDSVPDIAFHDSHQSPSPTQPIDDEQARLARRAYYAATTGP